MSSDQVDIALATTFLVELGDAMHALNFPSHRIEEAIVQVARGHGLEVDAIAFRNALVLEVRVDPSSRVRVSRPRSQVNWQLDQVTQLLYLLDDMIRGEIGFEEGRTELARIRAQASGRSVVVHGAAYAIYSGVVAARVGGSWLEMAVAAGIALAVFVVAPGKRLATEVPRAFAAALMGATLVLLASWLVPAFDLRAALFGGLVFLLPATMMTIAADELAHDRFEAGLARLVHAILQFVMLAAGVAVALRVATLWYEVPAATTTTTTPLPLAILLPVLIVGGCALTVQLRAPRRHLPWIVAAVLVAFTTSRLAESVVEDHGAAFLAAFSVAAFGYLQARLPGHVAAIVIVPGLFQLVPGLAGIRGVLAALAGTDSGDHALGDAILIAFEIVIGLTLAATVFRPRRRDR